MTATPRTGIAGRLAGLIVGSGCVICAGDTDGARHLCAGCEMRLGQGRALHGAAPAGIDRVVAAAPHDGAARQLVAALKFHRRLAAAEEMAARLAPLIGDPPGHGQEGDFSAAVLPPLVPVPAAPWRRRRRGFNPAAELASALARHLETGTLDCLRRRGEGHQVGRGRGARREPDFKVQVIGVAPASCILVDDVMTTGGTLTACAIALRRAGTGQITAATFTRRP